jgi:hypothetical protein
MPKGRKSLLPGEQMKSEVLAGFFQSGLFFLKSW